jgi:hypothetical protein
MIACIVVIPAGGDAGVEHAVSWLNAMATDAMPIATRVESTLKTR